MLKAWNTNVLKNMFFWMTGKGIARGYIIIIIRENHKPKENSLHEVLNKHVSSFSQKDNKQENTQIGWKKGNLQHTGTQVSKNSNVETKARRLSFQTSRRLKKSTWSLEENIKTFYKNDLMFENYITKKLKLHWNTEMFQHKTLDHNNLKASWKMKPISGKSPGGKSDPTPNKPQKTNSIWKCTAKIVRRKAHNS